MTNQLALESPDDGPVIGEIRSALSGLGSKLPMSSHLVSKAKPEEIPDGAQKVIMPMGSVTTLSRDTPKPPKADVSIL